MRLADRAAGLAQTEAAHRYSTSSRYLYRETGGEYHPSSIDLESAAIFASVTREIDPHRFQVTCRWLILRCVEENRNANFA
jgi:hypothetical protein